MSSACPLYPLGLVLVHLLATFQQFRCRYGAASDDSGPIHGHPVLMPELGHHVAVAIGVCGDGGSWNGYIFHIKLQVLRTI